MEAIELLLGRVSCPALEGPAPTQEQLDTLLAAADRAPDHGALKPFRFLVIEGDALSRLGELYKQAAVADGEVDEAKLTKYRGMPLRAPMILVVVGVTSPHPKVPEIEQLMTAGCAAHGVTLAAHALGLGVIWRTGDMAFNATVNQGLGLAENESVVGYLYLGQPKRLKNVPASDLTGRVSRWEG